MPNITVTTTIPADIYQQVKEKGLKVNMLIQMGWQAWNNFPAITARQAALETKNAELEARNEKLYQVIMRLQNGLAEMQRQT